MFGKSAAVRLVFATVFTAVLGIGLGGQEGNVNYNARLVELLEGYRELLSVRLDDDVEDNAFTDWGLLSRAINRGFLRFTVDPVPRGLAGGARFHAVAGKDVTHIIISRDLLDLWTSHQSTVYTVFTGAVREAAGFFRDPEAWGALRSDLMELLLIKVDGYAVQAELIENRLLPGGYLLSPYETYIYDSYTKDGLASAVLFLDRFSLPVTQTLYAARLIYEERTDEADLREAVLTMGEELLRNRNESATSIPNRDIFPLAAAIHSWLEFTPEIIARIHNRNRPDNPLRFDGILALEGDYAELRRRLEASRIRDMPLMLEIAEEVEKGFAALDEERG